MSDEQLEAEQIREAMTQAVELLAERKRAMFAIRKQADKAHVDLFAAEDDAFNAESEAIEAEGAHYLGELDAEGLAAARQKDADAKRRVAGLKAAKAALATRLRDAEHDERAAERNRNAAMALAANRRIYELSPVLRAKAEELAQLMVEMVRLHGACQPDGPHHFPTGDRQAEILGVRELFKQHGIHDCYVEARLQPLTPDELFETL